MNNDEHDKIASSRNAEDVCLGAGQGGEHGQCFSHPYQFTSGNRLKVVAVTVAAAVLANSTIADGDKG